MTDTEIVDWLSKQKDITIQRHDTYTRVEYVHAGNLYIGFGDNLRDAVRQVCPEIV